MKLVNEILVLFDCHKGEILGAGCPPLPVELKEAMGRAVRMDDRTAARSEHNPAPKPKPDWWKLITSAQLFRLGMSDPDLMLMAGVNISCTTAICMAVEAKGEKLTP